MDLGNTTSERFFQSLFTPAFTVLGRKLPPLSLWHLAALEAIESPFITGRGNVSLGDIQAAVQICMSRGPAILDLRPTLRDKWQNLIWNRNAKFVTKHATALSAHLASSQIYPELWRSEDKGGASPGSPNILLRVAALMDVGFSLSEALNDITPAMASWITASMGEYRGQGNSIVSDKDMVIMEHMRKEEKRG